MYAFSRVPNRYLLWAFMLLAVLVMMVASCGRPDDIPSGEKLEDSKPRRGFVITTDERRKISSEAFDLELRKKALNLRRHAGACWSHNNELYMLTTLGTDLKHHAVNAYLLGYSPFYAQRLGIPMQTLSSRLKYVPDKHQFHGRPEVWQTSKQAYYRLRGDCEDHAILLADWLMEMGHDARVAVGKFKQTGHAWVVLFFEEKVYIIEATEKRNRRLYPLASRMIHYHPRIMFNKDSFWINTGSPMTTQYEGPRWKKTSRFISEISKQPIS
jgi:hypothetical protein